MFKRLRQLPISLAAKCQLLFGAAVVMIIAAALFVPWHRMEQLTEQLNERAAGALADQAAAQHASGTMTGPGRAQGDNRPVTRPATATARAATTGPSRRDAALAVTARVLASTAREGPDYRESRDVPELARFEARALNHFKRHPESLFYATYYVRPDGTNGYRYAQPLHFDAQACARCHATADAAAGGTAATSPATFAASSPTAPRGPTTRAAALSVDPNTQRVGLVSVDFPSRIAATELLLNRLFLLIAGVLAGTLAVVVFYAITTRLILQPVRVLQDTAEKVSKGDLNIRAAIYTGDEFQQLAETLNTMLANLKDNADQLRSINKGLDVKLGQLAEMNVSLYESNRLKSEFLANVSHELRTPLNSILGFADLLKDAVVPAAAAAHAMAGASPGGAAHVPDAREAKAARYVNNILTSGRSLLDLINDLLDLAKIEAGRMEIRSEPLSVNDLFEGLTTILKPLAEQRRVTIVPQAGPDVPILHGDPVKLQQVLYNLLSNAIKFSPDGGSIDLAANPEGADHVRIAVTDAGPGIEPGKQAMIFEKFRQIDGSVTRSHSGTGLGLAISKELTQLMGGSIGVRSAPGEGATFWVVLPVRVQAGHADVRGRMALA